MLKSKLKQIGQGMTEYIIIVALIAIAAIAVYTLFGDTLRTQMGIMTEELAGTDSTKTTEKTVADEAVQHRGLGDFSEAKQAE